MGQLYSCCSCGTTTKVVPLKVEISVNSTEKSEENGKPQIQFYRPSLLSGRELWPSTKQNSPTHDCAQNSDTSLEIVSLSNRSSLATISLGSIQELSSSDEETAEREGAVNNRLQEEDIVHDREWQNSLPNIASTQRREIEPSKSRRLSRAFSSMGRMATLVKTPPKDTGSLNESTGTSQSSRVEEVQSGTRTVYTSLVEPATSSKPGKPQTQLIMVQPCVTECDDSLGTDSNEPIGESIGVLQTLTKKCPHGIALSARGTGEDSTHVVQCVRCERPASCGGRALKGLVQFRRNDKRRRKEMEARMKERLQMERDRRRQQEQDIQEALRKFAEAEMSMRHE